MQTIFQIFYANMIIAWIALWRWQAFSLQRFDSHLSPPFKRWKCLQDPAFFQQSMFPISGPSHILSTLCLDYSSFFQLYI